MNHFRDRFFGGAGMRSRRAVLICASALLVLSRCALQADWPEFRGPTGDGHVAPVADSPSIGFPLHWSETNSVRWKTEIPYRGWSTPVIMGGQVWLTTATLDGHDFYAICVNAETGKIQLNQRLFHCDKPEPLGNSVNAYATPSPAIEAGRVYVHFGSYGTACLETPSGKVLWQRQDLPCRHYRGPSSSLILFQDLLILTMDGVDVQYLVALNKKTGETVWKTSRSVAWNDENATDQMTRDGDRRKAHSTPLIVKTDGGWQLLSPGAKATYGYDPRDGRELWRVRYEDWSAAPRPLFRNGLAYFMTGLNKTELLAIRVDGRGDVTDTHVAWKANRNLAKTASPILVDDLLYLVSDEGLLSCIQANSGEFVWRERIGGNYAASPLYADGRLYFFNQQGKATVLKPGRAFQVLATNTLDTGLMASPAASGKALYLRTKTHLYRIESEKESQP